MIWMIPTIEYSIPIHLIQSFRILNIQFRTYSDYLDNLIFNSNSPSTINEYPIGNLPVHTPNECLVSNPPDPCTHQLNIQLAIRLNPVYTE
jgi:hypothetical protein